MLHSVFVCKSRSPFPFPEAALILGPAASKWQSHESNMVLYCVVLPPLRLTVKAHQGGDMQWGRELLEAEGELGRVEREG